MLTFAFDYGSYYQIIVTDGSPQNSYEYEFGKDQDLEVSIAESLLLVEWEIANKQQVIPTPV